MAHPLILPLGTLMETPIGSSASRMIGATPPGPMPTMPSTDPDLTIQPLDSTTASPTLTTQIEVWTLKYYGQSYVCCVHMSSYSGS